MHSCYFLHLQLNFSNFTSSVNHLPLTLDFQLFGSKQTERRHINTKFYWCCTDTVAKSNLEMAYWLLIGWWNANQSLWTTRKSIANDWSIDFPSIESIMIFKIQSGTKESVQEELFCLSNMQTSDVWITILHASFSLADVIAIFKLTLSPRRASSSLALLTFVAM